MIDIEAWIARALCLAAALVIIALSEPRLNTTTDQTRPGFRLAFVLLTVGGVWTILDLLTGAIPPWSAIIVRLGIALLLLEERKCPRSCAISLTKRQHRIHHHPGHHSLSDPPGA